MRRRKKAKENSQKSKHRKKKEQQFEQDGKTRQEKKKKTRTTKSNYEKGQTNKQTTGSRVLCLRAACKQTRRDAHGRQFLKQKLARIRQTNL